VIVGIILDYQLPILAELRSAEKSIKPVCDGRNVARRLSGAGVCDCVAAGVPPSDTNQQLDFRGCCAANCATAMGIQNTRLGEFGVADEMGFRILRTYRSR